ncbi:MAG: D-2-hydroxyacid dehydrogenase [Planctomycetaceae bacterium]|nr:D-2-hydroxyacid dehydrogenase [Planctomycetaceae bacterium]
MKIVVLDGKCLNPGDLSWEAFAALGELEVFDFSSPEMVLPRSQGATALITNKTVLSAEIMAQLPDLRYIGLLSTGINAVDCDAARERNIVVTNVPKYSTASVVQCTFAHLLNLSFHLASHHAEVGAGTWSRCRDFCYWNITPLELYGKTFGIIGLGTIGRAVAKIAHSFGMNVVAFGPRLQKGAIDVDGVPVSSVTLDQLARESDVISLHCPLTAENREMIDAGFLAKVKPSAFLINTARGPLIHEQTLADALNAGKIAGAGLDVLAVEPPKRDNPLLDAKNCYISPHIAWATFESRARLMVIAAENLAMFLKGTPQNQV